MQTTHKYILILRSFSPIQTQHALRMSQKLPELKFV